MMLSLHRNAFCVVALWTKGLQSEAAMFSLIPEEAVEPMVASTDDLGRHNAHMMYP